MERRKIHQRNYHLNRAEDRCSKNAIKINENLVVRLISNKGENGVMPTSPSYLAAVDDVVASLAPELEPEPVVGRRCERAAVGSLYAKYHRPTV